MIPTIDPDSGLANGATRRTEARNRRMGMATLSADRPILRQVSNGEEARFAIHQPTSFTKGLHHDDWGLVGRTEYESFRTAIVTPEWRMDGQQIDASCDPMTMACMMNTTWRRWESPLAGHYFTDQGSDPDGVAMAPAPRLGRSELCAEMALLYAMMLTRDVNFADLDNPETVIAGLSHPDGSAVTMHDLLAELRKLSWFDPTRTTTGYFGGNLTEHEKRRRASHWDTDAGPNAGLTLRSLFRGSTRGAKKGPYLSQFLLVGTGDDASMGRIAFGAQGIDQKIRPVEAGKDYLARWDDWLEAQQGAALNRREKVLPDARFVTTGRDLARYVHVDQLYQAYLNACLILLENKVPTDEGNPITQQRSDVAEGFATWGGPHILSLVTEVASRALRAVRRQKFQVHRRARPEVIGARLAQVANGQQRTMDAGAVQGLWSMLTELGVGADGAPDLADTARPGVLMLWVTQHNAAKGVPSESAPPKPAIIDPAKNYLLAQAFPEGSPMHPAYGAGHATVAGACVTILKAFFESEKDFVESIKPGVLLEPHGNGLDSATPAPGLTIAMELDKLAANIAIGRNMAGVHFHTDYYDSLRMGERVAVSILEEQMLTYNEPVQLSFTSFDGDRIALRTDGRGTPSSVTFQLGIQSGTTVRDAWWIKDVEEYGIHLGAPVGV